MPSLKCNIIFCEHREEYFMPLWKDSRPVASVFTHRSSNAIHSLCTVILSDSFVTCWENHVYITHAHAYTHKYTHILIDSTFLPSTFTLLPICTLKVEVSILKELLVWDFCSSASMVGVGYRFKGVNSCRYHFESRSPHLVSIWILQDKNKIAKKYSSTGSTTNEL